MTLKDFAMKDTNDRFMNRLIHPIFPLQLTPFLNIGSALVLKIKTAI